MHRVLLGAVKGQIVDHRNGNGLDNRRKNIRLCTPQENSRYSIAKTRKNKSSKYKGVHWCKTAKRWIAKMNLGAGKIKTIGHFRVEEAAAKAYYDTTKELYGEFWLEV